MSNNNNDNNNDNGEEGDFPLSEGLDASISEGDDSYFLLSYLMKRRQQQGRSLLNKGSGLSSTSTPTGPTASSSSPFNANITPLYPARKLKINRDSEKQQDNDQGREQNKNDTNDDEVKDRDNEYEDDFELDSPDNLSKSVMSFIDKSRNRMAIKSLSNLVKRETSPPKNSSLSPTIRSSVNNNPRNRPSSPSSSSKGIQAFVPPLPEARVPYPGYSTENLKARDEAEETEDIKVLRQLLRNSIADQLTLSQSSKSLMQDNKQLHDENKAFQVLLVLILQSSSSSL